MKEVENMEELVQLELDQVNKLLGVEAGRQLHTFINHSLLAPTSKKEAAKNGAAPNGQTVEKPDPQTNLGDGVSRETATPFDPIELENDESSD